jgi:hypothetical protein
VCSSDLLEREGLTPPSLFKSKIPPKSGENRTGDEFNETYLRTHPKSLQKAGAGVEPPPQQNQKYRYERIRKCVCINKAAVR